jgi:hypothetical protein
MNPHEKCESSLKSEIQESDLSREVRRLAIDIPATHVWKRAFESYLVEGRYINCKYGSVCVGYHQLLSILDEVKAPDDERRVILEKFMTSLRTEDAGRAWWQGCLLIDEVAGKRGLRVFTPEFEEALKKTRSESQP